MKKILQLIVFVFSTLIIPQVVYADLFSGPASQRKVHSQQELTQLATDTVLRCLDQSIKDGLIGAENLNRVFTHLREKNTLINPISEHERDQSTAHLLRYKTFYEIMAKVAKLHAGLDYAHIQNWLAERIRVLEENNRDRDRVHEETRELHRPMRFVSLPAGTYVDMIDHEEFVIPEGAEIQETPVTQFQWASVMGDNPSTHTESSELTDFTKEITINNNFVANTKIKMRADAPVETVSLAQIQEFIKKLNADAEKSNQDYVYALPSVGEYQALLQATLGANWLEKLKDLRTCQAQDKNKRTCPVASGDYLELKQTHNRVWDVVGNVWQWTRDQVNFENTNVDRAEKENFEHLVFGSSYATDKASLDRITTLSRPILYDKSSEKIVGLRLVRYPKNKQCERTVKRYPRKYLDWNRQIVEQDSHWQWKRIPWGKDWKNLVEVVMFQGDLFRHMIDHKELYPQRAQCTIEELLTKVPDGESDSIRYLRRLSALELGYRHIQDITPLIELSQLRYLGLGCNQIKDLNPLSKLSQLYFLNLYENQIYDLKPIVGLIQLKTLVLYGNQIQDLTPLSGLIRLKDLNLSNNPIQDLRPLAGLTQDLTLHLDAEQIERLRPYDVLPKNIKVVVWPRS